MCSRENNHSGACDKKGKNNLTFWKSSPLLLKRRINMQINTLNQEKCDLEEKKTEIGMYMYTLCTAS